MKNIRDILLLKSMGETLSENDLVAQQRLRLFKITTLFALVVFLGSICQVYLADIDSIFLLSFIFVFFIGIFINYFGLAYHRNLNVSFTILLALGFGVLHISSYNQGGIRSSGIFYLAAWIFTAYMLLGKAGGKIMACISIAHVIYFYCVSVYTNWVDYSLIGTGPGLIELDYLITATISIILLTAQANYIERSKNAVIRDIELKRDELAIKNTELLNMQRDLRLKNRELEQKNKELKQFAFVASHDLQEPLRTTSSFVQLLLQEYNGKLDEKADKYLKYIRQSSDRMQLQITDLLDFSRIGNSQEIKEINCKSLLDEVKADLHTAINETGAEFETGQLTDIKGYRPEMKMLFRHLVFNSIKFRRKNVKPRIKISVRKEGNDWQFAFADNGIGIAKEHYERIFIIFQRLHTRTEYKGSGIGLSHCRKIVEMHKGRIWLESELGIGTTFYFIIPKNTQ